MSANSAVQHLASGLGALSVGRSGKHPTERSCISIGSGFSPPGDRVSLWLAGRVRPAQEGNLPVEPTAADVMPTPPKPAESKLDLPPDAVERF